MQLGIILFPALILCTVLSMMLGLLLSQIIVQTKIVANHQQNWLGFHKLENDIQRFTRQQPLVTSIITKTANGYTIADKLNTSYNVNLTIDPTTTPYTILTWHFNDC